MTAAPTHPFAHWLWTPRSVQVRPVALLAAAALVLMVAGAASTGSLLRRGEVPVALAAGDARLLIQFRLSVDAREVALIGDFTDWQQTFALEEVAPGVWSTTVSLEPGVYDYGFLVDGETWTLDPLAPSIADGFGGANSRLAVLAPEFAGDDS